MYEEASPMGQISSKSGCSIFGKCILSEEPLLTDLIVFLDTLSFVLYHIDNYYFDFLYNHLRGVKERYLCGQSSSRTALSAAFLSQNVFCDKELGPGACRRVRQIEGVHECGHSLFENVSRRL